MSKKFQYTTIGPHENLGAAKITCTGGCKGTGQITLSTGTETCKLCDGAGKIDGLLGKLNQAGAEGWEVITHQQVGHPQNHHIFVLKREVVEAEEPEAKA